jgi:hypothetical protein
MSVIETVRFSLNPGIGAEEIKMAWCGSEGFVRAQPGFQRRRLVEGEDGTWQDIVEWQDMESAKAASAAFDPEAHPELGQLMAAIDPGTVQMSHATVHGEM